MCGSRMSGGRTEPARQPPAGRGGRRDGACRPQGGHPRTGALGRAAPQALVAQRGRRPALLLRNPDQGLRRGRRTEDGQYPEHGHEPCRGLLRRHRAGERPERNGRSGALLARQHGGRDALQRAEERRVPAGKGLRIVGFDLPADPHTPFRRGGNPPREGHHEDRVVRAGQSRPALGTASVGARKQLAQRRVPLLDGALQVHLPHAGGV